jgi:hypothetical protein
MRRKKKERLREEQFWNGFFYFNVPKHLDQVPQHLDRVNFRIYNVDDYGLGQMVEYVQTINMLDLDGTDITNAGIAELTKLKDLKELRLKECRFIDRGCIKDLNKLTGLTLLHLGGTSITTADAPELKPLQNLKLLIIPSVDYENREQELPALEAIWPDCHIIIR